jgi:hypothetical protein
MRRRARRSAQPLGVRVDRASAISVFASAVLTPLIVSLWARITPVAGQSEFDGMSADQLRSRNKWLDRAFTVLMFVGMAAPIPFLPNPGAKPLAPWLIGLAIGSMVVLPSAVIAALTLPKGAVRFREFWRYYEVRWGIGLKGIAWVYGLITLVWVVSLTRLLLGA